LFPFFDLAELGFFFYKSFKYAETYIPERIQEKASAVSVHAVLVIGEAIACVSVPLFVRPKAMFKQSEKLVVEWSGWI